ncbi:MAG: T9SS type A sorting domain-containing protein [Roseivirga sp.]|nr:MULTISPECIES: T9SS type A sorting domain-containing protein [Roseivirga]MBO6662269.1 T9SS type A sorting domain-containing protein [Roseivirga sp.]MBO6761686.1 T9SS type A sorting domain-containing protein [Roseivirga sp.]MBO6910225.1 T9SS type A sorting domain-containing protein [Roseivirga sp.]
MKVFSLNISRLRIAALLVFMFAAFSVSAQTQALANRTSTDPNEKLKVEIFPNPTSDFLNIDLSNLNLKKPQLEIRSIIGTKMAVNVEDNGPKKYKVDVQSFPRGYYLVLVRDDRSKFQQTVRFSKK